MNTHTQLPFPLKAQEKSNNYTECLECKIQNIVHGL